MANLEQAVIDGFNKYFLNKASTRGLRAHSFSLGGQDAVAGADYVLSDKSRFTLVEFKYTQNQIPTEKKKDRRLNLCKELESEAYMRVLHDKCHFIAWNEQPQSKICFNVYRLEVCNRAMFGDSCGLSRLNADKTKKIFAMGFTNEFFGQTSTRSVDLAEFQTYLDWLLKTASGSTKSSLQLIALDETSEECVLISLPSIQHAYDWMQSQYFQSTDRPTPPRP